MHDKIFGQSIYCHQLCKVHTRSFKVFVKISDCTYSYKGNVLVHIATADATPFIGLVNLALS